MPVKKKRKPVSWGKRSAAKAKKAGLTKQGHLGLPTQRGKAKRKSPSVSALKREKKAIRKKTPVKRRKKKITPVRRRVRKNKPAVTPVKKRVRKNKPAVTPVKRRVRKNKPATKKKKKK
jgi:hypothetical protein